MSNIKAPKKPRVDPIQKHVDGITAIIKKKVEKEFEPRIQVRIKEYIEKHMPELEAKREELAKKIEHYDLMINKKKSPFTADEFKQILMCLHPDGERSKEKLEEVFKLVKAKEVQLTGKK